MAYADTLRASTGTLEIAAGLIEGIGASTFPLTPTTWSPSYAAGGSMTFTSVTTQHAKYVIIGKVLWIWLVAYGTTGGSAAANITFTIPFTTATVGAQGQEGHAATFDGSWANGHLTAADAVTTVSVYKNDFTNWGLGASKYISVNTQLMLA